MLLVQLILAHLLGDFVLQTNAIFKWKMKSWLGVLNHAFIILVCSIALTSAFWGEESLWWMLAIIFISHFLQDCLKVWFDKKYNKKASTWPYFLDQVFHVALIVALSWGVPPAFSVQKSLLSLYFIGLILVTTAWDITAFQFAHKKSKAKELKLKPRAMLFRTLVFSLLCGLIIIPLVLQF